MKKIFIIVSLILATSLSLIFTGACSKQETITEISNAEEVIVYDMNGKEIDHLTKYTLDENGYTIHHPNYHPDTVHSEFQRVVIKNGVIYCISDETFIAIRLYNCEARIICKGEDKEELNP